MNGTPKAGVHCMSTGRRPVTPDGSNPPPEKSKTIRQIGLTRHGVFLNLGNIGPTGEEGPAHAIIDHQEANARGMAEPVTPFADTRELRQALIDTCFVMRDRLGWFVSTWGNLSVRVADGLLLTPTRVELDEMGPDDLVVVDWQGKKLRGTRVPTSELEMHRQLMLERPDIGVLIHTHQPYATLFACLQRPIPVITDDMAEVVGGQVNCSEYVPARRHPELAAAVRNAIGPDSMAVMIAKHGVICGGRNLSEAVVCCQFVEKAATIYAHAEPLGGIAPIPEDMWRAERHRYLTSYGKAEDLIEVYNEPADQDT